MTVHEQELEWILQQDFAEEYLAETLKSYYHENFPTMKGNTLIETSFNWGNSKKGVDYWCDIHNKVYEKFYTPTHYQDTVLNLLKKLSDSRPELFI